MSRLLAVVFQPSEATQIAGFAQQLGIPFDLLSTTSDVPLNLGAERVLVGNLEENPVADSLASAFLPFASNYSHIASVSTMTSKDVLARLAGLLDAAMITDVVGLDSTQIFLRPMLAGSILVQVEALGSPTVLTVRPAGFIKPDRSGESAVSSVDLEAPAMARRVSKSSRSGCRPDLSQAKAIVSGGRPLQDAETFEAVIGGLADKLGGAVGATRAAVDSGIAPNELQVGQTGKIVAPDLYIAAGISGSTQHMAGIKDSKIIVAINKDGDAPIFEIADFGLVADLFVAIPELIEKL